MLGGLISALRTLTIVPVPGRDAPSLAQALPWFPLVGALLGLLLYGIATGAQLLGIEWHQGTALVLLAIGTILTGALHLDGVADAADGLGGRRDRERALAIMKDSSTGAFGVIALCVVLLAKFVALSRLLELDGAAWIVVAMLVSRTMMVELAVGQPYARAEGGTGAPFVSEARWFHRLLAWVVAIGVLALFAGPTALAALAIGAAITWLYGLWCRRRLGGITGDMLGAGNELVETALLILAATYLASISTSFFTWGVFTTTS